jgi:hypothetical protein
MIDTLKISKNLEAAHLSKEQADAIAESIAEVTTSDLATKGDLSALQAEFHKSLGRLTTVLWITQLTTIMVILVGVGLLVHFRP